MGKRMGKEKQEKKFENENEKKKEGPQHARQEEQAKKKMWSTLPFFHLVSTSITADVELDESCTQPSNVPLPSLTLSLPLPLSPLY